MQNRAFKYCETKETNIKPAPFLLPFPGAASLLHSRLLYPPPCAAQGAGECRQVVVSAQQLLPASPSLQHFSSAPAWAFHRLQLLPSYKPVLSSCLCAIVGTMFVELKSSRLPGKVHLAYSK